MSKLECEVVKDLLPLYKDKLCSDVTAGLVDQHLGSCQGCRDEYDEISKELPMDGKVQVDAKDSFKKFVKKVNRKRMIYILVGIVLAVIIGVGGPKLYTAAMYDCSVVIPFDEITISDMYMTKEGYVRVHLVVQDYIVTAMRSPSDTTNLTLFRRHIMPEMTNKFTQQMTKEQTLNDVWISWDSKQGDLLYGNSMSTIIWSTSDVLSIQEDSPQYAPLAFEGGMTTLYELEQYHKYGSELFE